MNLGNLKMRRFLVWIQNGYLCQSLASLSFFDDFEVRLPAELTHCVAKSFSGPSTQPDRVSLEQAFWKNHEQNSSHSGQSI